MWKNGNLHALLVEMSNGAPLWKSLVLLPKVKHRTTTCPSNATPRSTPKGTESRDSDYLYAHVIHKSHTV